MVRAHDNNPSAPPPDARLAAHAATADRARARATGDLASVFASLASSPTGLTTDEAAIRLRRYGPNLLPQPRVQHWSVKLLRSFAGLFAILLWVGAILAVIAGMPELGVAIAVVVVVNGTFAFWQEHRAERAVEALRALLPDRVVVRRDGREQEVSAATIVPGDLLMLGEGALVPADARLVRAESLRVDLSSLTGESRPSARVAAAVEPGDRAIALVPNLVFAGTTVSSGRGEAVVFATGAESEFGRIAVLTAMQRPLPSPLERELVSVTRFVTIFAVAMGTLFFVVGTLVGGLSPAEGFLFGIGIIVANVPEGLLPTLTLSLALGVRRMAGRRALVKRLSSVEALGATTVILTDKTGTLTENEMTVRRVWGHDGEVHVGGSGYERSGALVTDDAAAREGAEQTLRIAALCCDGRLDPAANDPTRWQPLGDPTEAAILVAAAKAGVPADAATRWPRLGELPFDSVRKRMTTIHELDGIAVACVKGAPSHVLPRCTTVRRGGRCEPLDGITLRTIEAAHEAMAGSGLRVLAVARGTAQPRVGGDEPWDAAASESGLELLGLVGMEDPPRPEVPKAIAACRRAGIRVYMITGDSGLTAAAIGREIGLFDGQPRVVEGTELDAMGDVALDRAFDSTEVVFARVSPEHKLRLVESCQRRGEVVAVTGDGVNDAPALRRADIGVAMGATGTDVARQAADMVLVDDDFGSIVAAIEEGRAVYDNVRKFVTYIFASNVPEIVPFVAFVLLRIPLPLTVMQILAVDLGTDLIPALALGAEPPEPDVMDRPPRSRQVRLLDRATLLRAYAWLGTIQAVLCLGGFVAVQALAGWRPGAPMIATGETYVVATTVSFAGIVACQTGNLFACRSTTSSSFSRLRTRNRLLLWGLAVELALCGLLIYIPPVAAVFGFAPPAATHWLLLATFPVLLLGLEELRKAVARRRGAQRVAATRRP